MPYKTIDGITSSVIPFCVKNGIVFVLLGQRGKTSKAFANAWGLVGGFLDPGANHLNNAPRVNSKKRRDLKFHPIP
jgi:8-oxo-dGTP pyrophosphatase MutT (NUDIX family)